MQAIAHVVFRVVTFPGGTVSWPLRAFDSPDRAKEACTDFDRMLNELDGAQLVFQVAGGGVDTGMTLSTFLVGLGLIGVKHKVAEMRLEGLIETMEPGSIITRSPG